MSFLAAAIPAAASLAGGLLSSSGAKKAGDQNAELQREFAQNGIRWKVADAKAAGLHPLAAIGMSPSQASPSFTAGDYGFVGQMGQDISRAMQAKSTQAERTTSDLFTRETQQNTLANQRLQNDLLRSEIAKNQKELVDGISPTPLGHSVSSSNSLPPALPSPRNHTGQGDLSAYEAGEIPSLGYAVTPGGRRVLIPSNDMKQRMEDSIPLEVMWFANSYLPGAWRDYKKRFFDSREVRFLQKMSTRYGNASFSRPSVNND